MTVKCLSAAKKQQIIGAYRVKTLNQKELANHFHVSERTINRVLVEAGLTTTVPRIQAEARRLMNLLKEHNIDLHEFERRLAQPVLTRESVQDYLNSSSKEELATLFYTSGLVKVAQDYSAQIQTATLKLQEKAERNVMHTKQMHLPLQPIKRQSTAIQ